jgi:hypothetical protein
MPKQAYLGGKVRRLRRDAAFTQVQLAQMLGISPSYLNLIESNQRALTVPLLLKLADVFKIDLKSFASDDEAQLVADLKEVFSDAIFREYEVKSSAIVELIASLPEIGRGILDLYHAYQKTRADSQAMASFPANDEPFASPARSRLPAEEVSDLIQENLNHFPALEAAAEDLRREARLGSGETLSRLAEHLEKKQGVRLEVISADRLERAVRRYIPDERRLLMSEILPDASLVFQVVHQIGLLTLGEHFEEAIAASRFATEESKRLARVALANYFAGAVVMPYDRFLDAAESERYDLEMLEHRFRASFEQVCHRLTSLNRADARGIPFHLVRIDIAGNISKRFSGSGIPFARYSGACPRWNVHAAFLTPGLIRMQLSEMPDGARYFSVARTVRKAGGGHLVRQSRLAIELGCTVNHASRMVYADGIDLESRNAIVPVGVTCRFCERMDCRQRAFPPMNRRLEVDENVRGLSFYYSPGKTS